MSASRLVSPARVSSTAGVSSLREAAPGLLGRLTYGTNQSLRVAARTVGGKVVGSMVTGMISKEPRPKLPRRTERRARSLARKLAA